MDGVDSRVFGAEGVVGPIGVVEAMLKAKVGEGREALNDPSHVGLGWGWALADCAELAACLANLEAVESLIQHCGSAAFML